MKPFTRLPHRPHRLVDLALRDMEVVESNPLYKIDMGAWHALSDESGYDDQRVCNVCAAGAIMANTIKLDRSNICGPFDKSIKPMDSIKLFAIDYFRQGKIRAGLAYMSSAYMDHIPIIGDEEIPIIGYEEIDAWDTWRDRYNGMVDYIDRNGCFDVNVADYQFSPELFKKGMKEVSRRLENIYEEVSGIV